MIASFVTAWVHTMFRDLSTCVHLIWRALETLSLVVQFRQQFSNTFLTTLELSDTLKLRYFAGKAAESADSRAHDEDAAGRAPSAGPQGGGCPPG